MSARVGLRLSFVPSSCLWHALRVDTRQKIDIHVERVHSEDTDKAYGIFLLFKFESHNPLLPPRLHVCIGLRVFMHTAQVCAQAMPVPKRKRAARRPMTGLREITRRLGRDQKGWLWVAVWRRSGRVLHIKECVTDVYLEKRMPGKQAQRPKPKVTVGKASKGTQP